MIALIVLIVIILGLFLFKRFLDKYGKFIPSSLLMMFLKQVKEIEGSGVGKIVVTRRGDYEIIVLIENGKSVDAISVDMTNNKIYSGVVKDNKPNFGNLLVPIRIPFGSVDEKLSELEDKLVDEVMEIIVKYKN
jgi:hypothetical protein